jgi:hypothetical protein
MLTDKWPRPVMKEHVPLTKSAEDTIRPQALLHLLSILTVERPLPSL